ncbi:uncharacterized protein LOC117167498 isoform X2 [Belonocnema kinseyi]|uniref:uncharacterized protein LOC117167498 isoform X2 n=1 Tax=Belonocnema kinseyi TaxID=2817044 RepID=UPI00143D2782|nr:uncharacterized protein LOC117167498 isoform X2 [Belonocnema kinseyi]
MEEITFKIFNILTIMVTITHWTTAGVISLESDALHNHHHASVASSFLHFHGPVEGPAYEVKVPYFPPYTEYNHLHGQEDHDSSNHHEHHDHYSLDYVAHPKYQFSYGVKDLHTGDFHGQKESRDGDSVHGEYSVKEPGGTIRVVSYHSDKDGFHAAVHTSGKNDHSGGTYGGQGQTHYYHNHAPE